MRVLLAEDSALMAREIGSLLAAEFDLLGLACDGLSLVRLVDDLHPDVIVTDIAMPGLDGLAAAERIRSTHHRLGIVFITVMADQPIIERAMGLGACAYVLKSDAGGDLVTAVRAVAAGGSDVSATLSLRRSPASRAA